MHSSRMRTVRSSRGCVSASGGCLLWGVSALGGVCFGGCLLQGVCLLWGDVSAPGQVSAPGGGWCHRVFTCFPGKFLDLEIITRNPLTL